MFCTTAKLSRRQYNLLSQNNIFKYYDYFPVRYQKTRASIKFQGPIHVPWFPPSSCVSPIPNKFNIRAYVLFSNTTHSTHSILSFHLCPQRSQSKGQCIYCNTTTTAITSAIQICTILSSAFFFRFSQLLSSVRGPARTIINRHNGTRPK